MTHKIGTDSRFKTAENAKLPGGFCALVESTLTPFYVAAVSPKFGRTPQYITYIYIYIRQGQLGSLREPSQASLSVERTILPGYRC